VPGQTKPESTDYFGRAVQPIGGGGFTPTYHLHDQQHKEEKTGFWGTSTGPTFFGGWLSICTNTIWKINTAQRTGEGDVALLSKRRAEGCSGLCRELFTNVDTYDLFTQDGFKALTPEQKAIVVAHAVQLDYRFFENDRPPVEVRQSDDGKSGVILCTLCDMYCFGATCPIVSWPCCTLLTDSIYGSALSCTNPHFFPCCTKICSNAAFLTAASRSASG
jgi:hypothetical protein